MRHFIALLLGFCALPAQTEPLSYDYAYLAHQQSHIDGRSFANDAFGAYAEVGAHMHVFGSYGNAGAYGNPAWKDSRALRFGVGARVLLDNDTLIALEGATVRAQFRSDARGVVRDTGGSIIFDARHRFAPWLEGIASASHSDVLAHRSEEWVVGPVFHLNRVFALGAFYQRNDGHAGMEITLRTYY